MPTTKIADMIRHDQQRRQVDNRAGRRTRRVRECDRKMDSDPVKNHPQITRPSDRDRRGGDRILQDQVPADDPAHQLAHRRVGIRVGAAGYRNHRGELRVAQRRHRAGEPGNHERGGNSRSRQPRRRDAGEHEDAGADDRSDSQRGQIERSQRALEPAFVKGGVLQQHRNGLAMKQLGFKAWMSVRHYRYPASVVARGSGHHDV